MKGAYQMNAVELRLEDYIKAGYPAIVYNASDEEEALARCFEVAQNRNLKIYIWSLTQGVQELKKGKEFLYEPYTEAEDMSPDDSVITKGLELRKKSNCDIIYCLIDFHPFIKNANVWRAAKDAFKAAKGAERVTYIFISNKFEVPQELEHEVFVLNMDLPTQEELKELIKDLTEGNSSFEDISEETITQASRTALGLTLGEAENAFALSLSKTKRLDLDIINDVKKQIICKDGLLEYLNSTESLETVGGMHVFTDYAMERFSAYSPEAQAYGLPYPKGVLLVGIPGCGKSLAAKALANMWKIPLIKLDLGKLFGSHVGDTEANTRKALKIAESMAPCVLWLDEIEKGLSGVSGSLHLLEL